MPKGSKKRKSAKKKIENQPDNKPSSRASARPDESENSVGDVSSPASQDHLNHHNPFTEIEGGKIQTKNEGSRPVRERESKIGDESGGKNRSVLKHDEMETRNIKTHSGGSSVSSGNSSDEEPHVISYSRAILDSVKVAGSLSEKTTEAIPTVCVEEANIIPPVCSEKVLLLNELVAVAEERASLETGKAAMDGSTETISSDFPFIAPRATEDKESGKEKDSAITKPLLIVLSPSPMQKSSWKSCCGLFEVFSGSEK